MVLRANVVSDNGRRARTPGQVDTVLCCRRTCSRHGFCDGTNDDLDFEAKTVDIIGLYLVPPQHAVFCVGEKSAIQVLDRVYSGLLSPERAERYGFEYYRHGTLSLYAALDVKIGKVQYNIYEVCDFRDNIWRSIR